MAVNNHFRIQTANTRMVVPMDEKLVQEILDELFSSLEALETRSEAVLQFLQHKGLASQEELAPHLELAANASNVRWRAARVRINHLVSGAMKQLEESAENRAKEERSNPEPPPDKSKETASGEDEKLSPAVSKSEQNTKPEKDGESRDNRKDEKTKDEGNKDENRAMNNAGSKDAQSKSESNVTRDTRSSNKETAQEV